MKDMDEMIERLGKVFDQLEAGAIKPKEADSIANVAGKMIKGLAIQVEYAMGRQKGYLGKIAFLEGKGVLPVIGETTPDVPKIGKAA